MQITMKWLKELVEFELTPKELADQLTMAGISVESIDYLGEKLSDKVVVGQIQSVEKHPNADKLNLCQVHVGDGQILQIVCGADNVREQAKVAVALPGSVLPNGLKIKKAKLRGVESNGMICSVAELGFDLNLFTKEEQQGILILAGESQIGIPVKKAVGLDDVIFTLELTPNRADCLSVINVAREVAAITGGQLKLPEVEVTEIDQEINTMAKVEVLDTDLCGRYAARLIKGVKIAPSPLWMQERLRGSGIRPINNVVDVTNYVMLEMGQPLHAFDYDLLAEGTIIVRRGKNDGEEMKTLDEQKRQINDEMLVITDPEKPVAIAGVMGGFDTEVSEQTTNILLESACFDAASVRKTSRRLGMRSESSNRFEKGINIEGVITAINRAAQLLQQLAQGQVVKGTIDVYPTPKKSKKIKLRLEKINNLLGANLSLGEVEKIFNRLKFTYIVDGTNLEVSVPNYRMDIELEVDLIEEVARLYGYDNIATSLPSGSLTQGKKKLNQILEDQTRNLLTGCGLTEVITYSFINEKAFDKLSLSKEHIARKVVKIHNPLSEDHSVMRTTLIPSLLEVAAKNIKRRTTDVNVFELGKIYEPIDAPLPKETNIVAAFMTGKQNKGWGWEEEAIDFYSLKSILDTLLGNLGINTQQYKPTTYEPFLHPGRAAVITVNDKEIGVIGEVNPLVAEKFQIEQRSYVFHLNFDFIRELSNQTKKYKVLPKHPATDRDLAVIVKEEILADKIERVIRDAAGDLLVQLTLFDKYQGNQIEEGYKSLAYNLIYQAADRTLTDEEVNILQDQVRESVVNQLGAILR